MDFGRVTRKQTSPNAAGVGSTELRSEKSHGSVNLKHQRSDLAGDDWRLLKMTKLDEAYFSSKNITGESSAEFFRSSLCPLGVDDGQNMLSFSRNGGTTDNGCSRSIAFSIFPDEHYSKTGGRLNEGMRNGPFARMKEPFTPSQWMELEHQALIYKHIVANVPVPSNLLLPLKKSLYLYGSYASNFLGWGPVHLGFSSSNDPEPGRCRRTDGKKWRCSRDAVPYQKYCERHINRGRHRSRKPVEGHSGQAVPGSTTSNVVPIASSLSASVISSNSASNSLGAMPHHFNALQTNISVASVDNHDNRPLGFQDLSSIPPTTDLKSKYMPFPIEKQHVPFEKISLSEIGFVTSDSLVNPSERISFMNTRNSNSFSGFNDKEANKQQAVHHFIDDWPGQQSDIASGSWPEELKSDWTQLSMSIPVAPDFSSSSSSPAPEKSTIPTLRLSDDLNLIHMSLGGSHDLCEPVCWGNSLGGPLGEVLTSSTTCGGMGENPSSLKAWNNDSDQIPSSPTDILQKPTVVTLSNSSSGSSPPSSGNKKALENGGHCNGVFGSSLSSFAAIPSL